MTPLEKLPVHALRAELKEQDIKFKPTDKKKDLIKMLEDGKTIHKPREQKRAPRLEDQKTPKAVPVVPKEIRAELEAMKERGLTWEIDEESGCINFDCHMPTCANLDQSAIGILKTAKEAFGGTLPIETGHVQNMIGR